MTHRRTLAALLVSLSLVLLLTVLAEAASAKTFRVNNRRDKNDANIGDGRCDADPNKKGKQCTLRAASEEANFDEDTYDLIRVPKNVYKLTIPSTDCGGGEECGDIDLRGKTSIVGAGPYKAIIDAKKAKDRGIDADVEQCKDPPNHRRAFKAPFGKYCVIQGLGVKNGHPNADLDTCGQVGDCPDGGGFLIFGDSLAVRHIAAWRNTAEENGGGITVDGTLYQFNHITANHNVAKVNGGGIFLQGTTAHMVWVHVKGNKATGENESADTRDCCGDGGGIFSRGETYYDIKNITISNNTAGGNGGGLYSNGATDWYHSVHINNNIAKGVKSQDTGFHGGGGMWLSGTFFFFGFTVNGNKFTEKNPPDEAHGGGVLDTGSTITWARGTMAHNRVPSGGSGGGFDANGTEWMANVTITNNQAPDGQGGGINNEQGSVYLDNVTLASNRAPTGSNLWNDSYTAFLNTIVAYPQRGAHNCDPAGGFYDDQGHNLDSGHSCHFNLPSDLERTDPKLAPLRGNGGFSPTRALKPGSPAIDAGKDKKLQWTVIDPNFFFVYPFIYGFGWPQDMGCAETNLNDIRDDQRLIKRPQRKHCDIGAFEARNSKRSGNR